MDKPFLIVFAGPNGSGKTVLRKALQNGNTPVDIGFHINPDEIAAELDINDPLKKMLKSQEIAEHQRNECMSLMRNFSFETVMSHPSKLELMQTAKDIGYYVILYYVALESPSLNVNRVSVRVSQGGHDVPVDKIKSRYSRSLKQLHECVSCTDEIHLFDNSEEITGHNYILGYKQGKISIFGGKYKRIFDPLANTTPTLRRHRNLSSIMSLQQRAKQLMAVGARSNAIFKGKIRFLKGGKGFTNRQTNLGGWARNLRLHGGAEDKLIFISEYSGLFVNQGKSSYIPSWVLKYFLMPLGGYKDYIEDRPTHFLPTAVFGPLPRP